MNASQVGENENDGVKLFHAMSSLGALSEFPQLLGSIEGP
jgi:hypothetical protein